MTQRSGTSADARSSSWRAESRTSTWSSVSDSQCGRPSWRAVFHVAISGASRSVPPTDRRRCQRLPDGVYARVGAHRALRPQWIPLESASHITTDGFAAPSVRGTHAAE